MLTQLKRGVFCAITVGLVAGPPAASRAATFLLGPSTISNLYAGDLTLQIGGLTNGETVLVERFLDLNSNGTVDSGEPMVQSFCLTDGQVARIGGVRNPNVPGDNDLSVNGQITGTVNFPSGAEFTRGSGQQIFRVSSPSGRFAAAQQTLTVTQSVYVQQITGTVTSGGTPLPYAIAGLLVQVGTDNQFVSGTLCDGSGNFSINASNGTYQVIGFKAGYVGNFGTSPLVALSGANTNVTVPLSPGNVTVSGTLTDAATGAGVPGVQFFATSGNNDYLVLFSDPAGNFSASLIAGQWKLDPSDAATVVGGYLRGQNKVKVTVSTTDVTGVAVQFTKGTALIYGAVMDDQGHMLSGVQLNGSDSGNLFNSMASTDGSGNFFLCASNGNWYVNANNQNSGVPPGCILQQAQVAIGDGQAIQTNLLARHAAAYLAGRAIDGNGNAISGSTVNAYSADGQNQNASLAGDGSFTFPVTAGSWTISLESQTAASRNLVSPQLSFNVTAGNNISNITLVAPLATRTISGWVKNGSNAGIGGLNVWAWTMINGTNYNAGGNSDSGGNYSLPVLPGVWSVGPDSQGLAQQGYGPVLNQNADTSSANQTVDFIAGAPPVGSLTFRHSLGVVGDFGNGSTPVVNYPVSIRNYRAIFHVPNDTNPPAASTVFFTGPPGSGLTNTAADPLFGAVQDGTGVYYFSPPVRNPSAAPGGGWSVNYGTNANNFNLADPQAFARILVPLPTVTFSNGLLRSVSWSYTDQNGNPTAPAFVVTNRIDLLDHNGNLLDSEIFPATSFFSYPGTLHNWSAIGTLRVDYYDNLTNQYFVAFNESSATLTGTVRATGQSCQFLLTGLAGQNYTVQFATDLRLSNWSTLIITNSPVSPFPIVDPAATNASRFYRVLVGP